MKFGIKTNLNIQNSTMLFTFAALDWKYLSKKLKLLVEAEIWYLH